MTPFDAELAAFRGALLRARSAAEVAAATEAFVRSVPDDAARAEAEVDARNALELVGGLESARDMPRLRSALAARDALVRNAGDALIRDASELVRVIGELERKDALLKSDLQQALRFQRAMIAPLPSHEALALESLYLAAEVISGDFYDVIALDADRLRFFIADAAGHGIAAGLATMFLKSEYEAYKRSPADPASVLRSLNDRLTTTYRSLALRFSALCVDVYPRERRIRYGCAAHPGPLVVSSGGARALPSGGPFVGMLAGVDFPEREVELMVGELTAVYTDGLPDALDAEGKQFGDARVGATLAAARAQGIDACPLLVRALGDFVGAGRALVDDVAIVTFRVVA